MKLFDQITRELNGVSQEVVWGIAINLLVNSVRQSTILRKDAEERLNEIFACAKTLLLDTHYDSVTGKRRTVLPSDDIVVQMPFHVERNRVG